MTTEIDLSKAKVGDTFITRNGECLRFDGFYTGSRPEECYRLLGSSEGTKLNRKDGSNLYKRAFDLVSKMGKNPSSTQCPSHYNNSWAVGDFIRDQQLSFHLGNAIKYICRCDKKGQKIEDLQKAIHYLNNELEYETRRASKGVQDDFPGEEYFEWSSLPDH